VTPPSSTDVARPLASASTIATAVTTATARNPALASAPTTRVTSSTVKLSVTAPTTWTTRKTPRNPSSAARRDQRRARTAMSGAPTTIPAANAEVSDPAAGTDTPISRAMSGTSPDNMNSEVP
jgi:hypothetical protein